MGKKKFNVKQPIKKHNGYFEKQQQKYGEEFLNQMTPRNIQNDANRILRDIAHCHVSNITQYTKYFTNKVFVYNIVTYAYGKYQFWETACTGVAYFLNNNPDANNHTLNENYLLAQKKRDAYAGICNSLNEILHNISIVEQSPQPIHPDYLYNQVSGLLSALCNFLTKYRYDLE